MHKKNHVLIISAMLCVEFPQVWYIDFSQIIQVLKAAVKLTSKQ